MGGGERGMAEGEGGIWRERGGREEGEGEGERVRDSHFWKNGTEQDIRVARKWHIRPKDNRSDCVV